MILLLNFYVVRKDTHNPIQSLANMRLAAYLAANFSEVQISLRHYEVGSNNQEIITRLELAEVICLPLYMWTHNKSCELAWAISSKSNKILIVAGGPDAIYVKPEEWPEGVVFVVGEGEIPLVQICHQYYANGIDYNNLPDYSFSNIGSRIIPDADIVIEESLPQEGLFLFSDQFFSRVETSIDTRYPILWESSRGCPFRCGFCGHKQRKRCFNFSWERVESEISNLSNLEVSRLFIIDPILGGSTQRAIRILGELKKRLPDTGLMIYFRPELFTGELAQAISSVNIFELSFGLQTTNSNVPNWVRKNDMALVQKNLKEVSRLGLPWRLEFITGLPGDTFAGFRKSLNFGVDLKPTWIFAYQLTCIRGTEVHKHLNRFDLSCWVRANEQDKVIETNACSKNEISYMLAYGTAVCSLNNAMAELRLPRDFNQMENMVLRVISVERKMFESQDMNASTEFWKLRL